MCRINFTIQYIDADHLQAAEGRYKLKNATAYGTIFPMNISNLQTPDINVNGEYDLQVRVQSTNGLWSNWYTSTFKVSSDCSEVVITYFNTVQSGSAIKNNCTNDRVGSSFVYIVEANKYSSTISQADADQKAIDDVNANKQANANANGRCTCPNYPAQCNNYRCLIEGTLITLPNGDLELIENLKVGDHIYSVDIESLALNQTREEEFSWGVNDLITTPSTTKIVNITKAEYKEIYSLNNGLLEATWYHLHIVKRDDEWKIREFKTIQVGDEIIDKENNIIDVTSIELIQKEVTVYKLDVEEKDVYYANNILTHNK